MDQEVETVSPEDILKAIQEVEEQGKKGKLKIFLGMAAGVGKTYAMLQEAHALIKQGAEVVVGVIDDHGRKETRELINGLEMLPPLEVSYKETVFYEFDVDAALKRRPQLILVDELAHSNIPGSKHLKRWQDVQELIEHGINVYTTLNVQHIESLKDIVESVVEIPIRETVPDSIIEQASFIEVIDIPPDGLLERLREGKVYLGAQPEIAMQHFFQEDRLTALREIILRFAAEKVDHELHTLAVRAGRGARWRTHERLMVAVSHSPHSKKLIRTARRLAFTLDVPWIAVYVNTGAVLDDEDNANLAKNLELARDLGAEVIATNDPEVYSALYRIARLKNVTQIIIGRSPRRGLFGLIKRQSLLERLVIECPDIDIHVIRQESELQARKKISFSLYPAQAEMMPYLIMSACVLLLTLINWMLLPFVGYLVTGFIFLLGILTMSLFLRKGPIFVAAILYALIWDSFFIPEGNVFTILPGENEALLGLYFLTAILTGILIDRERDHKEMLLKREERVLALYEIVRGIAEAASSEKVLQDTKERVGIVLNGSCEIFLKDPDNGLLIPDTPFLGKDEKAKHALMWVFENNKEAGWSTPTLPGAHALMIPLKGFHDVVGVFAYRPKIPSRVLTHEEKNFFYSVGHQIAAHFEREYSTNSTALSLSSGQ